MVCRDKETLKRIIVAIILKLEIKIAAQKVQKIDENVKRKT